MSDWDFSESEPAPEDSESEWDAGGAEAMEESDDAYDAAMSDSDFSPSPSAKKKKGGKKKAAPKKKKKAAPKKKATPKKKAAPKKKTKKQIKAEAEAAAAAAAEEADNEGDDENKATTTNSKKRKGSTTKAPAAKKARKGSKTATTTTTTTGARGGSRGGSRGGGSKKKAKVKTVSKAEGTKVIEEYLLRQNRPYSYLQVFENLHKVVKKSQVTPILDELTAKGVLTMAQFNKTKLYFPNQEHLEAPSPEELKEMDERVTQLRRSLKEKKEMVRSLTSQLSSLMSKPTNDEADKKIAENQAAIDAKMAKLNKLENEVELVSAEEQAKTKAELKKYYDAWRKRKQAVMDMVDAALGDAAMKPKQFLRKHDCELDEDYKVDYKDFTAMTK